MAQSKSALSSLVGFFDLFLKGSFIRLTGGHGRAQPLDEDTGSRMTPRLGTNAWEAKTRHLVHQLRGCPQGVASRQDPASAESWLVAAEVCSGPAVQPRAARPRCPLE